MVIIVTVVGFGLVISDVAGNLATDSKALPNGAAIGKALVVYNPGLSGAAKDVATKIGYNLQSSGYDVTLAGIKSSSAAKITGYGVIVVGGPIYAGKPSSSVQSYLNGLNPLMQTKIGVFGSGGTYVNNNDPILVTQDVAALPSDSSLTLNAVVKITSKDNSDSLVGGFVDELLHKQPPFWGVHFFNCSSKVSNFQFVIWGLVDIKRGF